MNLWNKTRGGAVPALTLLLASLGASHPASATSLATPILSDVKAGHGKVAITVTAGNTGAPAGFATWWMKESDFLANGSNWFALGSGVDSVRKYSIITTSTS